MLQTTLINQFLDSKVIAVVGVSRSKDIPANGIFNKFKSAGYEVYPINPNAENIEGEKCYPDLGALPSKPDAVLLASTPEVSEIVVGQCLDQGINKVWMHRGIGNGSYSTKAESFCRENEIDVITNGCPMMFIKPIDPFHRIFRWFK